MEHVAIGLGEIHAPHNWEFADQPEREAASITDADLIGRLALQLDDGSYWRLGAVSPSLVWESLKAEPTPHEHTTADITGTWTIAQQPEYEHTQGAASTTWTINHNFGRRPKITLFTDGGLVFVAQIQHTSDNQAVVSLSSAMTGKARCIV